MAYQINGTDMGLAPFRQTWRDLYHGTDHNGRPLLAATKSAELEFDQCAVSKYAQFSALVGASLTSIQLLNLDAASYTVYSNAGIVLTLPDRPAFDAGNVTGFRVVITGISF